MSKRILIADDEPHMLRVTELSLKKGGFDILLARNGRQAVEMASIHNPDLIVMDVVMPEMDGFEALRELKASPLTAHIPVMMLTSRGQSVIRDEAESAGAVKYVTKPFSPSQLLAEAKLAMGVV
ncbi:MAG: response regulator [Verrucomicrobia bacterium]|nr:response regulator [Verrucomicrobiota bacterium]